MSFLALCPYFKFWTRAFTNYRTAFFSGKYLANTVAVLVEFEVARRTPCFSVIEGACSCLPNVSNLAFHCNYSFLILIGVR